jgi:mono/diheme cytochrome c family protein
LIAHRSWLSAALLAALSGASADEAAQIEHGRAVFERYCTPCHGDGPGDDGAPMLPGTHALHLKYRGELPALLEDRSDLTAETIRAFVRSGIASMPPFRPTEVTNEDIDAIAAYLAE